MYILNMNKFIWCIVVSLLFAACSERDNNSNWKEVSCRFFSLDIPFEYSFEEIPNEKADWTHFVIKDEQSSSILDVFESSFPNGSRNGDVYGNFNSSFQLIDAHVDVDGLFDERGSVVYSVLYGRYTETGVSSFVHFVYLVECPKRELVNQIIQSIKNPQKREMEKLDVSLPICNRIEKVLPFGYSVIIDDSNFVCRIRNSRTEEVAWVLGSNFVYPPKFKKIPDSLLSSTFELIDYYRIQAKMQTSSTEMKYSEIYGKRNKNNEAEFVQFIYTDFMKKSELANLTRSAIILE